MGEAVSTNEMDAFEISHARACDVLSVDDDGLGFVPRAWLDRTRAMVTAARGKRYGAAHGFAGYTLVEMGATFGDVLAGQLACDLLAAQARVKELEATLVRVRELPEVWKAYRYKCCDNEREAGVEMCEDELEAALAGDGQGSKGGG
jgi:hypothetical protein